MVDGLQVSPLDYRMNPTASEIAFKLEIVLMRDDYRDNDVTTRTVENHIRRVARQYKVETWFIRGLVEEAWKDGVGYGRLACHVCGRTYASHPIGHCPDLAGEPVYVDPVSARTMYRRRLRANA